MLGTVSVSFDLASRQDLYCAALHMAGGELAGVDPRPPQRSRCVRPPADTSVPTWSTQG